MTKVQGYSGDRYILSLCVANKCELIGLEQGYTEKQLKSFNGHWQQVGSVALGVVEVGAVVIAGTAVFLAYAAEVSAAALFTTVSSTIAIPTTAFTYFKKINPVVQFKRGGAKAEVENAMNTLNGSGQHTIVIYKNGNAATAIKVAERLETVLKMVE